MTRRLSTPRRRAVGFKPQLPAGTSSRDAWAAAPGRGDGAEADLFVDDQPRAEADPGSKPKRQSRHTQTIPCNCNCLCGNKSVTGMCGMCKTGIHHVCSRACGEFPPMALGAGLSTEYIHPRHACDGGGLLGKQQWKPTETNQQMIEHLSHRATS